MSRIYWLKLEINRQENASYIFDALVLIIIWPSPNLVSAVFKKQNIWTQFPPSKIAKDIYIYSHLMKKHIPSRRLGPWRCSTTRKASTNATQCWNKKQYPRYRWQSQTIFPSSLYKFQVLWSLFFFQYNRSGKNFQNPFCYQYFLSPNLFKKIYVRYPFY